MFIDATKYATGRWMSGEDLNGAPRRATIVDVSEEQVEGKDGQVQDKLAVSFKNARKPLLLNKVNTKALIGLLGRDASKWVGATVQLYPIDGEMQGTPYVGVRIRADVQKQQLPPATPAEPETADDWFNAGADAGEASLAKLKNGG